MKAANGRRKGKEKARAIYAQWRQVRDATVSHGTICDCDRCSLRRRLGGQIVLPYAGAPRDFTLKENP